MTGRHGQPTRVVVAPDKFKGSLTAEEAAAAIARGIRRAVPGVEVVEHPIADGGEGTVDAVVRAGWNRVPATVTGPTGDPVQASYAVRGASAVIELAAAAGLACLPPPGPTRHTALTASTRGLGELVTHALDRGARAVTVAIGGSATTDGGSGLLTALGARVLTSGGEDVPPGGAALTDAVSLDLAALDRRLEDVDLTVACDVDNPLAGPTGAATVFAPQKGALPQDVELLDRALAQWADVVDTATGADQRDLPGAGAAGGVGFALAAVLGARLRPGIGLLLELTGLRGLLAPGTLVVVGEGSLDAQSLRGKGPIGVARAARAAGATVVALAGRSEVSPEEARAAGLDGVWALADVEPDPARSMADAGRLLEELAVRLAPRWTGEGAS